MNRTTGSLLIELLRPIAVPFGLAAKATYWLLLGWWLDGRMSRQGQNRLAQEIRQALPFLFSQYKGRVVPSEGIIFPEPFDYSTVTVLTDDLLIRFIRGRGELGVNIAPAERPNDWHELPRVIRAMHGAEDVGYGNVADLSEAAGLLQANIEQLNRVLCGQRYEEIKNRLAEAYKRDRAAMREWEFEMNKRLR